MQRFVLLAERRSGTTLLVDCLNNLPRVHCEKRAFGIDKRVKDPDENKHSDLLFHYRHRSWRRRLRFYLDRERLIREFLDDEIFASGLPRDIRGFRLIYDKTVQHPEILSCLRGTDTGIIHLIRQNILKTHISSVTAPMHRMYHPRAGASIRTVKVLLDPDRLLSDLRERQERIERHRRLVAGFPVLEVIYESFTTDRDVEPERIQSFLGLDTVLPFESDLIKINPDTLGDLVQNLDDVRMRLAGTEFERFLD